jgi:hypothetical protein
MTLALFPTFKSDGDDHAPFWVVSPTLPMSYNPFSFDQYTSTPSTPTSGYPWDPSEQHQLEPPAQAYDPQQAQAYEPQQQQQHHQPQDQQQHQQQVQVPVPTLQSLHVHQLQQRVMSEPLSASSLEGGGFYPPPLNIVTALQVEGTGSGVSVSPTVTTPTQSLTGSLSMPLYPAREPSRPGSTVSSANARPSSRGGGPTVGGGSVVRMSGGPVRAPRSYGGVEGTHGSHPYRRTSGNMPGGDAGGATTGMARSSPEASTSMSAPRSVQHQAAPLLTREPSAPPPTQALRFLHYQGPPPKAPMPSTTTMGCPAGGSKRKTSSGSRANSLAPVASSSQLTSASTYVLSLPLLLRVQTVF